MSYNRLAGETSPYLRQHAGNPVHWWPWCREALETARREDRPILLSIGYAACHWCHVMAHESFEDPETAALMNAHFVNIKVDREERPDIDRHYMRALRLMGEQGGWPLTMFLAPDGRPFWGGTYFPPRPMYGRPSFRQVLSEIARLWKEDRQTLLSNAETVGSALAERRGRAEAGTGDIHPQFPRRVAQAIGSLHDPVHGGMDAVPRFPQWPVLDLLLKAGGAPERMHALKTLRALCSGGIYDHLDGGLARYSTDERWLVPHFEKMLYDNAQFIGMLVRAWLLTGENLFRIRLEETIGFLRRRLFVPGAGFASSLDADSEGEEGRYYVWSWKELDETVSPGNRDLFFRTYGVTRRGNWEGRIILNRLDAPELLADEDEAALARERARLLARREKRIPPARDDKIIASWNGLAITALAEAALVFGRSDWATLAGDAFHAVHKVLGDGEGLRQSWLERPSRMPATADGPACMISAAIALHGLTGRREYLERAMTWWRNMEERYLADGVYAFTAIDAEDAASVQIFAEDEATPNHNARMVRNLVHLFHLAKENAMPARADAILARFAHDMLENPVAHAAMISAFHDRRFGAAVTVIHAGDSRETEDSRETRELLRPVLKKIADIPPILHGTDSEKHPLTEEHPALLLCRGASCSTPVADPEGMGTALSILDTE